MNTEDIIRMAREAGLGEIDSEGDMWFTDGYWDSQVFAFAALVAAAEQRATLDTVDELIGMEQDRGALFSEGYDHALFHIKQFVEGRGRVK
jgi:hypothetical protein